MEDYRLVQIDPILQIAAYILIDYNSERVIEHVFFSFINVQSEIPKPGQSKTNNGRNYGSVGWVS
jgi:hypothetical protein